MKLVHLPLMGGIGGAIVYAVYALAYTLWSLCMLGLHKFRPSQINFSSTKSLLSMITTVMKLCSGWFDQPISFSILIGYSECESTYWRTTQSVLL